MFMKEKIEKLDKLFENKILEYLGSRMITF